MRRAAWLLAVLALAGCGGDEEASRTTAPAPGGCREVAAPQPRSQTTSPPWQPLEQGAQTRVVVETSCGSFTITLDPRAAPNAAGSFASLAGEGFFDGTSFHRIVPGFVIQGGDPTGSGSGGPGYTTLDEPPAGTEYPRGTVAMAKTPIQPPGTAGSQFFVVTKDAGLPPEYAVIGVVTEGMPTVDRIEALGDPATELPRRPVIVDSMTVENG